MVLLTESGDILTTETGEAIEIEALKKRPLRDVTDDEYHAVFKSLYGEEAADELMKLTGGPKRLWPVFIEELRRITEQPRNAKYTEAFAAILSKIDDIFGNELLSDKEADDVVDNKFGPLLFMATAKVETKIREDSATTVNDFLNAVDDIFQTATSDLQAETKPKKKRRAKIVQGDFLDELMADTPPDVTPKALTVTPAGRATAEYVTQPHGQVSDVMVRLFSRKLSRKQYGDAVGDNKLVVLQEQIKGIGCLHITISKDRLKGKYNEDFFSFDTFGRGQFIKFIDCIVCYAGERGISDKAYFLPLEVCMTWLCTKNETRAREMVQAYIAAMDASEFILELSPKKGEPGRKKYEIKIIGTRSTDVRRAFEYTLDNAFVALLYNGHSFPLYRNLPKSAIEANAKYNPWTYLFGRALAMLNSYKNHHNEKLTVKAGEILELCPDYPTHDEAGRRVRELIIEPFERDMNKLEPDVTWAYVNKGGDTCKIFTTSGRNIYHDFIQAEITVTFNNLPTKRVARGGGNYTKQVEYKPVPVGEAVYSDDI